VSDASRQLRWSVSSVGIAVALRPPLSAEAFGAIGPPVAGVLITSNGDYGSSTTATLAVATFALGIVLTVGRARRPHDHALGAP
jgi:hypothetical protein